MPDDRPPQAMEPSVREDCILAEDILRGRTTVRIRHGSDTYVLRLTRSGKLILTK